MRKIFLVLFFLATAGQAFSQQIPLYSLYMFNGLVMNPAYAGSSGALNTMLHFRDQWSAFAGHPTTLTILADSPLRNERFSLGGIFSYDKFAITKRVDYIQSFSYRIALTPNSKLAAGFQGGFSVMRMDWSELGVSADDQAFAVNPSTTVLPKLGMGLLYTRKNLIVGISAPQMILRSTQDLNQGYTTKPFYTMNGQYTWAVNTSFDLKPSFLIKYTQTYGPQVDLNLLASYKNFITAGASYRTGNALVFMAEFKMNQLRFGYAYDYYLNSLRSVSKGSHEIMLKYTFRYMVSVTDPRNFY